MPDVQRRLAVEDPVGHDLPDAARARQPVRAEARRDEEAGDLGLAEAELVVGRERLGPVDEPRDAARRAIAGTRSRERSATISSKRAQSSSSRRPLKSGGIAVDAVLVERPRRAAPLVAAHDEAAALLAEVDEQLSGSRSVGRCSPGARSRNGWVTRYSWAIGHDRHAHAGQAPELGGEHPARVDDDLGLDRRPTRSARRARGRRATSMPVTRVWVKIRAPPAPRALGQRVGQLRGVEVAVGRQVGRRRARRRCPSAGSSSRASSGRDQLERQPERPRPGRPGGAAPPRARACRPGAGRRTPPSRSRAPR